LSSHYLKLRRNLLGLSPSPFLVPTSFPPPCSPLFSLFSLPLCISSSVIPGLIPLPLDALYLQDVVVLKSPDPTKFKLANAFFPGVPVRSPSACEQERTNNSSSSSSNNAVPHAELAAVEPASTTPSPTPPEGAISIPPLILLKGAQFRIPGTMSKFPSQVHSTPPGLVEAGWDSDSEASAEG
jgi:hypothetical protein